MAQVSINLKVYFVETSKDFDNPPFIPISLLAEECQWTVENIRDKIHEILYKDQDPQNPLGWRKKYNIYLEDGKNLNLEDKFPIYFDEEKKQFPPLYFSSNSSYEFLENKKLQEQKKRQHEEKIAHDNEKKKVDNEKKKVDNEKKKVEEERAVIIQSLQKNIRDLVIYNSLVSPNFLCLMKNPELQVPTYQLNSIQLNKLNEEIKSFKDDLSYTEFFTEHDRDDAIAQCIRISLKILRLGQYDKLKFHHQFSIKPHFSYSGSGIERVADIAVYEESFNKIVNINEIKKEDSDIEDCIRQNADQLRAYCLCYDKKIGRGIATTGENWIFTQYNKSSETFKISKSYEFFKKPFLTAPSFNITDNYKAFFEALIGFIEESIGIMNNN